MTKEGTDIKSFEATSLFWKKFNNLLSSSNICSQLIKTISSQNKSWAIVGGTLRVWATSVEKTTNDLDIVVGASTDEITETLEILTSNFSSVECARTKLGGFRIKANEIQIDIWAANQTIGILEGKFIDSNLYRAVSKSAALSLDSMVFTSKGTIYERGFFDTLTTGILKLNHSRIEQAKSIAYKAIRLCNEYDLIPDLSLQTLILAETKYCYENLLNEINAFNKHYMRTGSHLVKEFENIVQSQK